MSHEFEAGFFVRQPAWHGLGTVIPDFLPLGTEEEVASAMELAGHNFDVVRRPVTVEGQQIGGWEAFLRSDTRDILHIARDSYTEVSNRACWDIMRTIVGEGLRLETAVTLRKGAICSLLAWLNEPSMVKGDNSPTLPFYNLSWSHDGSGSVQGAPTSVRVVCMNTWRMVGKREEVFNFSVRHTKNALSRLEDVKLALRGLRAAHEEYIALANELAEVTVNNEQVDYFLRQMFPMPNAFGVEISKRVLDNIDGARESTRKLLEDSPTVPAGHRRTAYGLFLAGTEYLDHVRPHRSKETYYGRTLLRQEPAKQALLGLIKEAAAA